MTSLHLQVVHLPDIKSRELDTQNYAEWDRLVNDSAQGTVFHHTAWVKTYEGLLNLKVLGCYKEDQLVGGCILNIHKDWFLKSAANFGIEQVVLPYEGIILGRIPNNAKASAIEKLHRDICNAFLDSFKSDGFHFIRLVNSPGLTDIRPFTSTGWKSTVRYTYVLDVQTAEPSNFSRDVRRNIRKAAQHDVTIERTNDASTFFELYQEMLARKGELGASNLMRKVLERIIPELNKRGLGELWIARTPSGEAVSGEIVLFDKKRAYGWLAATSSEYLSTGVSSFLRYRVILELKKAGLQELDLVGADGRNTSQFKASFNPRLVPYYMVAKSTFSHKVACNLNRIARGLL